MMNRTNKLKSISFKQRVNLVVDGFVRHISFTNYDAEPLTSNASLYSMVGLKN